MGLVGKLYKRLVKGEPLTYKEMDDNFSNIEQEVDGKANATHTHSQADVQGLKNDLDGKLSFAQKGQEGGVAELDENGRLKSGQVNVIADSFTIHGYENNDNLFSSLPKDLKFLSLANGMQINDEYATYDFREFYRLQAMLIASLDDSIKKKVLLPEHTKTFFTYGIEGLVLNISANIKRLALQDIDVIQINNLSKATDVHIVNISDTNLNEFFLSDNWSSLQDCDLKDNMMPDGALDEFIDSAIALAEKEGVTDVSIDVRDNVGHTSKEEEIQYLVDSYNWTILYDQKDSYYTNGSN